MTTIHRIHPAPPMRGRFNLDVCHEDPGEVVIYVVGELDIATTPVLRGSLSDLLDVVDIPWSTLAVDLAAAPFVDVSAAGLLLNAHRRAEERGSTLSLMHCSAQLVRLLHLAYVVELIEAVPAHDE
jgi:anti-sigma B factor antagonist